MAELTLRVLGATGLLFVLALVGCGSSENAAPEPTASVDQAQVAASSWTPEMKDKFKAAHERARSGQDDKPADGGSK